MLKRIATRDVEPADLDVALAPRLNLLAGDNGLGKTFLLDLAWWALTGTWARNEAIPRRGEGSRPRIEWERANTAGQQSSTFWFNQLSWDHSDKHAPGLVIYGRPDGAFEILDTVRTQSVSLTAQALWDGLALTDDGPMLCNGLVRDWVTWQFQKPKVFDLFSRILAKLSPHPDEILRPGAPRRVSIEDARDIPTIVLPYGEVPVTHASAGMRRILALAYVLVWSWYEHTEAARLTNRKPLDELVLLIDEVDAHLHPTWQRVILPALFEVFPEIEGSLRVQVLASTHAPLVLASVETLFDEERDALLHFVLREGKIVVEPIPWAKQGDAASWLVSDTFGLPQARSREAQRAIEAAEAFMRGEATPPDLDTKEKIHAELQRVLGGHDDFWPRWLVRTGAVA